MPMTKAGKAFIKYVNAGVTLADQIKIDIAKDGIISTKTILKLNDFIVAYNEIADTVNTLADKESRDPNGGHLN